MILNGKTLKVLYHIVFLDHYCF